MAAYFRRPGASGCCGCAEQESACDGCGDCNGNIAVHMEVRYRSNYGSKCGMRHPFTNEAKWFRSVSAEFSLTLRVDDGEITFSGLEVGAYFSTCTITASYPDPCESTVIAEVTWDSIRTTNYWSGNPVVAEGATSSDLSQGGQTDVAPWVRSGDKLTDCWTENQIMGRDAVGQPSRYVSGIIVSGLLTGTYELGDVGDIVIPAHARIAFTPTGGEVWARTNDQGGTGDGFGWSITTAMQSGDATIEARRTLLGRNVVTLDNEFTSEELKALVMAGAVASDWGPVEYCAYEFYELSGFEYTYQDVQFRFVYDYSRAVRIGYRINVGGVEGETQFVESPGDRIFTIFPSGANFRCPEFVSAETCL
jgi:hypothetical protein